MCNCAIRERVAKKKKTLQQTGCHPHDPDAPHNILMPAKNAHALCFDILIFNNAPHSMSTNTPALTPGHCYQRYFIRLHLTTVFVVMKLHISLPH